MSQQNTGETRPTTCTLCRGTGVITCFACSGRGVFIKETYGFTTSRTPCSACGGTGIKRICQACTAGITQR